MVPPTEPLSSDEPLVADVVTEGPTSEEVSVSLPPKKHRRIRLAAALTGVALLTTALGLGLQQRNMPVADLIASATTDPVDPGTSVPGTAAPGGTTAGINTFASVSVDVCASMMSQIGASNPFAPGVVYAENVPPQIQGSGGYTKPTWSVELPDTFDPTSITGDLRPSEPSMLNAISDGHALLYSPLSTESGSRLGVYRLSNGELVWSTALASGVYPMSDTKRLYLIDRTSELETRIAVISPSRAQIEQCYAATGNPTPAVSPTNRSAVAYDGTLYVAFPVEGRGTTIEALNGEVSAQVLASAPAPLALHGVMDDGERRVLLTSYGTGAGLRVSGYTFTGANVLAFERTAAQLNAAPVPEQWGRENDPTAPVAAEMSAQIVSLEVQRTTVSGAYATLALGTNAEAVLLTALDIDGTATWRAPIIPAAASGLTATGQVLHIAKDAFGSSGGPFVDGVVVDLATGNTIKAVQELRYAAAIGNGLVAHSIRKDANNRYVVSYRGAEEFGGVGGPSVTALDPIASSEAALLVVAEVDGKRYIVAFVLDPTTSEGPTS